MGSSSRRGLVSAEVTQLSWSADALFRTEDFIEGRKAEAEGRRPIYLGR
jgi:hypothetical protein